MTTEAQRLLSEGMPIEVADGGEVRLRYTMGALARCEAVYGNLAGTIRELRWLVEQVPALFPEPVGERLATMIRCVVGSDVDVVSQPAWCIEALMEAWLEAFPPVTDDAPKG